MLTPKTVAGALKAFTKTIANLRAIAEAQAKKIEIASVKQEELDYQVRIATSEMDQAEKLAYKLTKLLEV